MTEKSFGSRWIVGVATAAGFALGGASVAKAQEGEWYIGANMPLMFIDDTLIRSPPVPSSRRRWGRRARFSTK